jgi:hypothetical protein
MKKWCVVYCLQFKKARRSRNYTDGIAPSSGGHSYVAFANMLIHTQSLRSLTLISPFGLSPLVREGIFLDAAACGL